jgi:hypothetical protein
MENGLHIKSHILVSIKKPFSKTQAPLFEIGVPKRYNFTISTLREML